MCYTSKYDWNSSLYTIRTTLSPELLIDNYVKEEYYFLDENQKLIERQKEKQYKIKDLIKYDMNRKFFYIRIDLHPKYFKDKILVKNNGILIGELPMECYKMRKSKIRKMLNLKDNEFFIDESYSYLTNEKSYYANNYESYRTLSGSVVYGQKENIVNIEKCENLTLFNEELD